MLPSSCAPEFVFFISSPSDPDVDVNGDLSIKVVYSTASIYKINESTTLIRWLTRKVLCLMCDGMKAHVMTFEAGAALEDPEWQAPAYCFGEKGGEDPAKLAAASSDSGGYPVNGLGTIRRSMSLRSL